MLTACSSAATTSIESAGSPDRPTIVVSTNILGDVVQNIVGDAALVVTIMPVGSDPHDFQPSAQQIAQLNEADAVIINGGGFEEGLVDIVEAAEADGTVVLDAIGPVETLEFGRHEHGDDDEVTLSLMESFPVSRWPSCGVSTRSLGPSWRRW